MEVPLLTRVELARKILILEPLLLKLVTKDKRGIVSVALVSAALYTRCLSPRPHAARQGRPLLRTCLVFMPAVVRAALSRNVGIREPARARPRPRSCAMGPRDKMASDLWIRAAAEFASDAVRRP